MSGKVVFKPYDPDQATFLPYSLEELVPLGHPVRIVKQVVDQVDVKPINRKYKGGGASSFHPRLMLKLLIYGYLSNTYSSRKLEEQAQQNIHFMWLLGMKKPDHNTINRFRSEKLSGVLKEIFSQIVLLLNQEGIVSLKEAVFNDGTKIESAANRYSFVWGKSIKTNKEKIKSQLDELWQYAQGIAAEELKDTAPLTFEEISPEKVKQTVARIDAALDDKPQVNKKVKQKLNYAKKNWPENLERYQQQQEILQERNKFLVNFSNTMTNGQHNPGSITFKLYHINSSGITALSKAITITEANFESGKASLDKEFTFTIEKSKLTGGKIDILYDSPGFPYPVGVGSGYAYWIGVKPSAPIPPADVRIVYERTPYPNSKTLFRLYDKLHNVHFITASVDEANTLLQLKTSAGFTWWYESMLGFVKNTQEEGTVPFTGIIGTPLRTTILVLPL